MAHVRRKISRINVKKALVPNAKKGSRRGPSPGTLHTRRNVSPENVAFVKDCILPFYKKARPWHFLKPEERENANAIATALTKNRIVTGTMQTIVKAALIELDFQGVIDLPAPKPTKPKKTLT